MRPFALCVLAAALICVAAVASVPAAAATAVPTPRERALYRDGPAGRYVLDRGWTARADPADAGLRRGWQRPGRGAGFRPVRVPHAFNARDLTVRGFRSWVHWYRLRLRLPPGAAPGGWRLRFESVNRRADVFLNGRRLGSHEGAHLPFELPARGVRAGVNELVVRVDGRLARFDIPPSSRPRGWWNYGGILREVYLRRVGRLDVTDLHVRAQRGSPARVTVAATVRNATSRPRRARISGLRVFGPALRKPDGDTRRARLTLVDVDGALTVPPGRSRRLIASFSLDEPKLWSPEEPHLYSLRLQVPGAQEVRTHFGIREWGVDAAGRAVLNGRRLSLRGASFHEDTRHSGGALGPRDRKRIVGHLLALGANVARAHYPPHPALLEDFDRLGIVYWDQLPVWRWRRAQFASPRLRREALRRLRRMVMRDRNHASIITWSVSNETLDGGAPEARYVREAVRAIRRLDRTRLVSADTILSPLRRIPSHYDRLDMIGLNEYLGWYAFESADLRPQLDRVRERFPRQALFVGELGAEADRDGPPGEKGTYAFQRDFLADHLRTIDATPYLGGALVWALRDFPMRPGWTGGNPRPNPPFNYKGLLARDGTPKPAFDTLRILFNAVSPTR